MSAQRLDELIAEAELGEAARAFVGSELGQVLIGFCRQEVLAAQEALGEVKPCNVDKIKELQNIIWRAKKFEEWLSELIGKGTNAMEIFKHEQTQ